MTDTSSLYRRDLGGRPQVALVAGIAAAVLCVGLGIRTHPLVALAALPCLALGLIAYLRVTTYLTVAPGVVTARSRMGDKEYEANDLTLELRGDDKVFVLAHRDNERAVVCVFKDDDIDETQDAFRAAGVTVAA
jgi:hypothetical protein